MDVLEEWGLATSRRTSQGTNRGTIARLVNTELFCVLAGHEQPAAQPAGEPAAQPAAEPLTNKEDVKAKSEQQSFDDDDRIRARASRKISASSFGPKATKKEFLKLAHSCGLNGESEELWSYFTAVNWRDDSGGLIRSPRPYLCKCAENPRAWLNKRSTSATVVRPKVNGGAQ
jgi:hypothetical protein